MNTSRYVQKIEEAVEIGGYDAEKKLRILINEREVKWVIEKATQQASTYLPHFNATNPEVTYPNILIQCIVDGERIDPSKFPRRKKYHQTFNDWSIRIFDSSLDYLEDAYNAIQDDNHVKAKPLATNALFGFVNARITHFWQQHDPVTYNDRFTTDEKTFQKVNQFNSSQIFKTRLKELWFAVFSDFIDIA